MSTPSDGGPAFPGIIGESGRGNSVSRELSHGVLVYDEYTSGMSVRVYLCAHAPECPVAFPLGEINAEGQIVRFYPLSERQARWRTAYADAQIALLEGML